MRLAVVTVCLTYIFPSYVPTTRNAFPSLLCCLWVHLSRITLGPGTQDVVGQRIQRVFTKSYTETIGGGSSSAVGVKENNTPGSTLMEKNERHESSSTPQCVDIYRKAGRSFILIPLSFIQHATLFDVYK